MGDERIAEIRKLASQPTWDIDCAPDLAYLLDENERLREGLERAGAYCARANACGNVITAALVGKPVFEGR